MAGTPWTTRVKNAFEDVTTLSVITTTGNIELTAAELGTLNSWEGLPAAVTKKIKTANLTVVAFTEMQIDCDSFTHVASDLTAAEQTLLTSHNTTVSTAIKARSDVVKSVSEMIKSVI